MCSISDVYKDIILNNDTMILFPAKNIYAQAIIFNTSFILYFLPINQSLSHIIQFYGKGNHLALISLERFGILLGFHLLRGSIHATVS